MFDSEAVARAIAACPVPVVSGIGHEDDTTVADLVADHRAATPTAAMVALLPDRHLQWRELTGLRQLLKVLTQQRPENPGGAAGAAAPPRAIDVAAAADRSN